MDLRDVGEGRVKLAGKKSKRGRWNTSAGASFGGSTPNWPDQEFPWVLKTRERKEREEKEEIEKLRLIERFLESGSESEDEDMMEEEPDREQDLGFIFDAGK